MAEHYDVIIIGTGAGGGRSPTRSPDRARRILLLERGNYLPREMDNWDPAAGVRRGQVHLQGHLVRRATASRSSRRCTTSSGGATKLYGAALYRLRPAGLRRAQARRRDLAGLAAVLRRLRAVVHQGRAAVPGARQRRRGPDRGSPVRAVSRGPRCRTSPASSSSPTTWPTGGCHPFHAPCGILLDEADRPGSTCIRCTWCDGYPCLVHAKSDAEVIAVRPVLDRHNVTLLTRAEVTRLETDPSGRTRHRRRRHPRR